ASQVVEPTAATPPAEGTPFHLNTPGPTVPEGHWRWTGSVIDQDGNPLAAVCVHIGPGDCRFNSIRTDDKGKWVIDFPQVEAMYDAYKGRIYTFLLRFLGDPELADDVTQETFAKAYGAFASLTNGHRVLPWLYRIASNTAVDQIRRRRRFSWLRLGAVANTAEEPHMRDEHGRVPEREHIQ